MTEIDKILESIQEQRKLIDKLQTEKFIQKVFEYDYGDLTDNELDEIISYKMGNYSMYKMNTFMNINYSTLSKQKKKQYKELLETHLDFLIKNKDIL